MTEKQKEKERGGEGRGKRLGLLHKCTNTTTTFASSAPGFAYSGSHTTTHAVRTLPTDSRADHDQVYYSAHRGAPIPRPRACRGHADDQTILAKAILSRRP